jgi:hypothetical protein
LRTHLDTGRIVLYAEAVVNTKPPREGPSSPEAHYASLERPHACIDGWVFVGYTDEYGEEREASYRCRRCDESR